MYAHHHFLCKEKNELLVGWLEMVTVSCVVLMSVRGVINWHQYIPTLEGGSQASI